MLYLLKYLSQTFFVRRNVSYFIRLQLKLDFFHSYSVFFLRSYFSYFPYWCILKKIYGGLFEAVHKLFDEISQNIGKLKKIFMKAHYFKLQFFGQPLCENCLTAKRDSYWVFWT